MESNSMLTGLLPLWILGAPWLAAMFAMFATSKPALRTNRDERVHDEESYRASPSRPHNTMSPATSLAPART